MLATRSSIGRRQLVFRALLAALGCVGLMGCAHDANNRDLATERFAWTDGVAAGYDLTHGDLHAVQFWASDDIHLRRLTTASQRDVEWGRLVQRNAKAVDEIIVKRGTPGVAVGRGHDWVAVSFEPGSYLYFTARRNGLLLTPTRSGDRDRYYLWAQDWRGGAGIVPVNGVLYEATPASANAHLLVERRASVDNQRRRQVQRGREIYTR